MITIHLVDGDPSTSAALPYFLSEHGFPTKLYRRASELLTAAPREGVILFDLRSEGVSAEEIQRSMLASGAGLPLILIGTDREVRSGIEAMKLGAYDFLRRPLQLPSLIAAIESAVDRSRAEKGRRIAREAAVARIRQLPQREVQILRGLMGGLSNKEMARLLGISPRTVEMHRAHLMEDLRLPSLSHAVRLATEAELTPLEGCAELAPTPEALLSDRGRRPARSLAPIGDDEFPPVLDVLEGTTDAVIILDRNDHVRFLNRNAMTAMDGRDLIGASIWDVFPMARSTRAYAELRDAAGERRVARFDFYSPDVERWFDVNVRPIPQGLLVCFRDITPKRDALAQLMMSEERILMALDAAGDGAWDFDVQSGRILLSERYMGRLGYGKDEIEGSLAGIRKLIHPEDLARFDQALRDHLMGQTEVFRIEYRLRRQCGEWAWGLERGRIVSRDSRTGAPLRMVGTSTDIGWVKELRAEAAKARAAG